MKIDSVEYKGLTIELSYLSESKVIRAKCLGIVCDAKSAEKAIDKVEGRLDRFLGTTPTTWDQLADKLTSSLIWTGYEDCYVDEFKLKTLVVNFLKAKGIELPDSSFTD